MSENAQDLQSVEISIAQAKASIARRECLMRLEKNPDFKELILDGFLKDHAVRQVMLRAAHRDEKLIKDFDTQITAVGQFNQFLIAIHNMGLNAAAALVADEQTREDLLQEGLDNG